MKQDKCPSCGHIQDYELKYCQRCGEDISANISKKCPWCKTRPIHGTAVICKPCGLSFIGEVEQGKFKVCPFCTKRIPRQHKVCFYCTRTLIEKNSSPVVDAKKSNKVKAILQWIFFLPSATAVAGFISGIIGMVLFSVFELKDPVFINNLAYFIYIFIFFSLGIIWAPSKQFLIIVILYWISLFSASLILFLKSFGLFGYLWIPQLILGQELSLLIPFLQVLATVGALFFITLSTNNLLLFRLWPLIMKIGVSTTVLGIIYLCLGLILGIFFQNWAILIFAIFLTLIGIVVNVFPIFHTKIASIDKLFE